MNERILIIVSAFLLDLIFGDPKFIYHPICLIGNFISFLEKKLRTIFNNSGKSLVFAGGILFCITVILSFLIPYLILNIVLAEAKIIRIVLEIFWCYQIFAVTSLKNESNRVYKHLKYDNISKSRKYLSYIVGRETAFLEKPQIIKATVETIAENFTDAVIAPMIFMAIGGAPLGFTYKAINTLDSMVGYKNEKYFFFGKISAKMDDLANLIPARISAILLLISALICRKDYNNAMRIFIRDRKNHASPNSAQTESVVSGALNIQLGGDAYYFGKLYKKPTIGDKLRTPKCEDILDSNNMMQTAACLGCLITVAILFLITR